MPGSDSVRPSVSSDRAQSFNRQPQPGHSEQGSFHGWSISPLQRSFTSSPLGSSNISPSNTRQPSTSNTSSSNIRTYKTVVVRKKTPKQIMGLRRRFLAKYEKYKDISSCGDFKNFLMYYAIQNVNEQDFVSVSPLISGDRKNIKKDIKALKKWAGDENNMAVLLSRLEQTNSSQIKEELLQSLNKHVELFRQSNKIYSEFASEVIEESIRELETLNIKSIVRDEVKLEFLECYKDIIEFGDIIKYFRCKVEIDACILHVKGKPRHVMPLHEFREKFKFIEKIGDEVKGKYLFVKNYNEVLSFLEENKILPGDVSKLRGILEARERRESIASNTSNSTNESGWV